MFQVCDMLNFAGVDFISFVYLVFVNLNIFGDFALDDPSEGALFLFDVEPKIFYDSLKFNRFCQTVGKLFIFISNADL